MSAARHLLAWLWAAIWLRWRLAQVKLRPLLEGGSALAGTGPDYHLEPAEIPVEGRDYAPDELPADLLAKLEATRLELRGRARRAPSRSGRPMQWRRTAAIVAAALLGLGTVGAGATALVNGSTGVPAVDRLLGLYEAELEEPGSSGRPGGVGSDFEPRSSGSSTSVEVSLGSRQIVSTSYVARDGRVCVALTSGRDDRGDLVCLSESTLATRLDSDGAILAGILAEPDATILTGFVRGDVTDLVGRGPGGPLEVHLGRPWTPDLLGVGTLRSFLALGDPGTSGLPDPRDYVIRGQTNDGDTVNVVP
ncbi:MAG TPA: hypothetical protein VHF88_03335 [Thermoleophilaceae bacterium]|nr:hypothetical protein [Thermoleophilaceae bacterium]